MGSFTIPMTLEERSATRRKICLQLRRLKEKSVGRNPELLPVVAAKTIEVVPYAVCQIQRSFLRDESAAVSVPSAEWTHEVSVE